jgi:hypothetical protein
MSTPGLALVAIPIGALWLINALWLGRRQDLLAAQQAIVPAVPAVTIDEPAADAAGD